MPQTDGKVYHVLGLEESILSKWLYHLRQSTDSMQSLSNYHGNFHRTRTENFTICMETQDSEQPKQSWERKTKLEESGSLISDCTWKLQSSKQCGTGTKTEI